MVNGVYGRDGTHLSRDGIRLMADKPIVIRRYRPPHVRADGYFPDTEEEQRQREESRRKEREHRLHNTDQ